MGVRTCAWVCVTPENNSVLENRLKTIEESTNSLVTSTCMEENTGTQTVPTPRFSSSNNIEPLGVTTDSAGGVTWASIPTPGERND